MAFHWNSTTLAEMTHGELRIVAPGINVKLVGDAAVVEQLMQLLAPCFEAVVVIVADIEINLQFASAPRQHPS